MTADSVEHNHQFDLLSVFKFFSEEAAYEGKRIDLVTITTDHPNGADRHYYSPPGIMSSESEAMPALVEFVNDRKVLLGKLSELEEQAKKDPRYEHPESHCKVQGRSWLAASGTFFFGIELIIDDFRKEENARTYYVQGVPKTLIERIRYRHFSTPGKRK